MMKQTGTVLLYNMEGDRAREVGMLCMRLGIKVRKVEPAQYGQPIGALFGLPGQMLTETVYEGEGFSDEMLIMKDLPDAILSLFLQEFGRLKIRRVDLKAMLTPYNAQWDSVTLHDEIKKEREAILSGQTGE